MSPRRFTGPRRFYNAISEVTSVMRDEEQLRAIWKGQAATALQMTPQQLRTRAAHFESAIRRRQLRDLVSFALVAVISAFGLLLDNPVVRVGAGLIVLWALF